MSAYVCTTSDHCKLCEEPWLDLHVAIIALCYNAMLSISAIYTSTIKSPSAVQISKSIKQTQSVDTI